MVLIFLLFLLAMTDGAERGGPCTVNNLKGTCVEVNKCRNAIEDINSRTTPHVCQTTGIDAIVCCNESSALVQEEYCDTSPAPRYKTAGKTGKKAWDKCIEYQKLVFPCNGGVIEDQCPYSGVEQLIAGGTVYPKKHEFPHLVLLGYTNEMKELDWLCAGSLISDLFVLTAAHCVSSRISGPVTHVALHPTDRSVIDPAVIYRTKSVIRHPEYRPPRTYHDIALLQLEQAVPLGPTVVPACIVGGDSEEQYVKATTWNTNDILSTGITLLRKVQLTRFSVDECSNLYPESRRGGYNDTTQLCYGDKSRSRDVCQDDGGGPLMMRHKSLSCMYSILGIASYGKGCFTHSPGVYTRVEKYVDWIESIAWP